MTTLIEKSSPTSGRAASGNLLFFWNRMMFNWRCGWLNCPKVNCFAKLSHKFVSLKFYSLYMIWPQLKYMAFTFSFLCIVNRILFISLHKVEISSQEWQLLQGVPGLVSQFWIVLKIEQIALKIQFLLYNIVDNRLHF